MKAPRIVKAADSDVNSRFDYPMYLLLGIIVFSVAVVSIPGTPIGNTRLATEVQTISNSVIPQGWAFFTKSSQDPAVIPFDSEGNSVSQLPTSRLTNSFGINRKGRSQGVEVGLLQKELSDSEWTNCDGKSVSSCIAAIRSKPMSNIVNTSPRPSLCGDVFLLKSVPRPFAYRHLTEELRRQTEGVGAYVHCSYE